MRLTKKNFWIILAIALAAGCTNSSTQTVRTNSTAENLANAVPAVQTGTPAAQPSTTRELDVPYVPTHQMIVDEMLRMAEVKASDVLYDLGSGDGRIPITAA
ncbi:MAG: SAM-dependent methyltransferase, partial [Acidobacteria bacterium]|nr:SAM-dependent methyltransferase [Acidobacteriota bacterium]